MKSAENRLKAMACFESMDNLMKHIKLFTTK